MQYLQHAVLPMLLCLVGLAAPAQPDAPPTPLATHYAEHTLAPFGGIPFIHDLDGDGADDILWLQSPGLFHSNVFDKPPWNTYITPAERDHFCLTATRADGTVLWQLGTPWQRERPFITHCAERGLDAADIDGDGVLEVATVRHSELLLLDGRTGAIERQTAIPSDNGQIVRLAHTGSGAADWTILVKNSESAYAPHEYANPAWFYNPELTLIKTADFLGAGHAPLVQDLDGDGRDEFIIGFNRVDSDLQIEWTYAPVPPLQWDAAEMHVDDVFAGEVNGRICIALAASDTAYLLDAADGSLLWKYRGTHPQHCQIGDFTKSTPGNEVFVHNKRAELQLFDATGNELWNITPPKNFPWGEAEGSKKTQYHVFDPTELLAGVGPGGTDLLLFTDGGWPYGIDGGGRRALDFPYTPNSTQDWGAVPGRPDDYGYGFYARAADFDGDGVNEVMINDRRFAWFYEVEADGSKPAPRSAANVLHADFENYTDGIVQALNAGVRWLGDPFSNRNEGTVEITKDFAGGGSRSGHVASASANQIARIRLQPRFDAPEVAGSEVVSFLFRPVREGSVDLHEFTIWSAAGLKLIANGDAGSGTFHVDVVHTGADSGNSSIHGLPQDNWTQFVMQRNRTEGTVALWAGPPADERFVGAFPDPDAGKTIRAIELGDTSLERQWGAGYWDDIRVGVMLAEGQAVAPPEPPLRDVALEAAEIEFPIQVTTQKQLFADDVLVAAADGLTRTLHPVTKHPANPLVVPDRPWEGHAVLLYGSVIPDPETGKLRMWYLAWGKHLEKPTFICYAESVDGLKWTKPNLGLVEFEGSTDNNIVMPGWSQNVVLHDPRDPDPARRYKAMLRLNGTRGFFSPDGLHWQDAGIILDQSYDATTVQWNPFDEKWIAMVKIFRDGKRARGYAESTDFLNWSDTYYLGAADELDQPGDEMYAIDVFPYESLLFGQLRMYHTATDKVDIQLMTSRNGKQWNRAIRTPFIPCADEKGSWDYANNAAAESPPVRMGDELWLYYSGRSTLHDEVPNTGAIGVGTLRADGFFSMDAGPAGGVLTTVPLVLAGDTLCINADADGGEVRVEVLDEAGAVIPTYAASQCTAITENAIRIPVVWTEGGSLASLAGQTVRLRFHMNDARFYAFWME